MIFFLIFISQAGAWFDDVVAFAGDVADAVGNTVSGDREKCITEYSGWKNSVTCGIGEKTRTYKYYMCE